MTIEKARQILKEAAEKLTDEQIQSLIDSFNLIIDVGLEQFEKTIDTKSRKSPAPSL